MSIKSDLSPGSALLKAVMFAWLEADVSQMMDMWQSAAYLSCYKNSESVISSGYA